MELCPCYVIPVSFFSRCSAWRNDGFGYDWCFRRFQCIHASVICRLSFDSWKPFQLYLAFHYLFTTTFIWAEKHVGKTLAYNWGVNNEKAISVILDNFLFAWTPSFFPVYIFHRLRECYELSIPLPDSRFETNQELFEKGKGNFTRVLDLSKS